MTKLTWRVRNVGTGENITSRILSMNINDGREKYLDNYSGGQCVITIKNENDYASGIVYGSRYRVDSSPILSGIYRGFSIDYWVQEVTFNDEPGDTGLPTATIVLVDWLSRSGRISVNNIPLDEKLTGLQFNDLYPYLPSGMFTAATSSDSIAAAIFYTGTINNYVNLLQTTEHGYLATTGTDLYFVGRSGINSYAPNVINLGRSPATSIAYQDFNRIQNGTQFINTSTISPTGLASQTAKNTASVTAYGPASNSSATVDYSTTQALGNATWTANTFADPNYLRFTCTFSDVAQDQTILDFWMNECWELLHRRTTISYKPPGQSLTSVDVLIEGAQINVTPDQTVFTLFLSPMQYYQYFTLNSTTLGILNTSRLGW